MVPLRKPTTINKILKYLRKRADECSQNQALANSYQLEEKR